MKYFGALLLVPILTFSQNKMDHRVEPHPYEYELSKVTFYDHFERKSQSSSEIREFILNSNELLQNSELVLEYVKPSKAGYHYSFVQKFNGREIYLSQIKVNTDVNYRITSVIEKVYETRNIDPILSFPSENKVDEYAANWPGIKMYESKEVYGYNGIQLIPARLINLNDVYDQYFEVLIDYFGNEIYRRDTKMYFSSDTSLTGNIFNPDPLTSALVLYGAPYTDSNDSDLAVLNAQQFIGTSPGKFSQGQFLLENDFVKLSEFSNPVTAVTTSANSTFNFPRSADGFEDYNAFCHINRFKTFLLNNGYSNLVDYQIEVDAHALSGADNSAFQGNMEVGRLLFGEGGVDDAEDADVVIHEYGHAISTSASNSNVGIERRTVDEAIGDYFAALYSKLVNPFDYERVFSWDGHNEFWAGRKCVSTKCYTNVVFGSSVHQHADLFSSFLVSVTNQLGNAATFEILVESMYSYAINISMQDAAMFFLQADTLLNGGVNGSVICQILQQYCFSSCVVGLPDYSRNDWEVKGSYEFSTGGTLEITGDNLQALQIELFDQLGRKVTFDRGNSEQSIRISSAHLTSGIYFLSIGSGQEYQTIKLIRY